MIIAVVDPTTPPHDNENAGNTVQQDTLIAGSFRSFRSFDEDDQPVSGGSRACRRPQHCRRRHPGDTDRRGRLRRLAEWCTRHFATVMTLLGSHAWWTPGRLDRMLSHVDPEGGEPD